jgi:phenylpropionate dioxygenase-like ring-hydroxylating dioxygenase large terminal subunit
MAIAQAPPELSNFWHPIANSSDVIDQPKRFPLLGDFVVAFRDEQGVAAFRDLCIHRGAALSLGWIKGGRLTCPYHGWQYDRTGKCVRIPSRPDSATIPKSARAQAYRAVERYGMVWVTTGEPTVGVPGSPDDCLEADGWKTFLSYQSEWATSAARVTENFMDFSHFPYVHTDLLGTEENAQVAPYEVERRDDGLFYEFDQVDPSELYGNKEGAKTHLEYTVVLPFTVHLKRVDGASGEITTLSLFVRPSSGTNSEVWVLISRNHSHDRPNSEFGDFTRTIMEQDRGVVESQRPEELPTSLREELHIKVPDAASLTYRQQLAKLARVDVFGPYGA